MDANNISLADVRAELRQVEARAKLLKEIEADLLATERKWEAYRQGAMVVASKAPDRPVPRSIVGGAGLGLASGKTLTKKQMIIEALNAPHPLWQTANEVRDKVSAMAGKEVPMSSISPALSDLKNSDTIVRNDMVVALALRVDNEEPGFFKENEPPTGNPESGSETDSA